MELVNSRPELMNLSFSGCGFLCVYHAGVAAAIKEYAPQLLQNKILGASAGSIIACGLITNVCISNATSTILKVISQARLRTFGPLHPEFSLLGVVREELEKILPKDAYQMCTGRLIISLTRWSDHKNVMIDEYTSNEDLIDAIMCSCFIPLYCGIQPPKFRGVQYIDGGVSDNQPCYDEHTVTVSPFSGESDICPPDWDSGSLLGVDFNGTSIRFTARNMFRLMACLWPRSTEDCSKMCIQGFKDALRFLTKFGLSPCIRCLTIQTIDPCVSEVSDKEDDSSIMTRGKCMTSPTSTANLGIGRMRNRSSTSILNMRARGESECEACCDSDFFMEDINVDSVFPKIMQKPFKDAIAAEKSVFEYFLSFRIVRYATTALGISKFPLDIAVAFVKMINNYLDFMSPPRWFLLKFRSLTEFIVSEVEKQKTRYTKFSCLVAVTEVDRFGSALAHSTMENNADEKEIELSEDAKKELRFLRERDRRRRLRDPKQPSTSTTSPYDVDSFEHVVQFTKTHDLMYEFHYIDENNEKRTCGLFAADNNHRSHQHPSKGRQLNKLEEEEEVRFIGGKVSGDEEEIDSGLSGVDAVKPRNIVSSSASTTSKRDACCSPVREFSEPPPAAPTNSESSPKPGRGRGTGRRYNNDVNMRNKPSTPISMKKTVVSSSDSEEIDGTEKLFVPSRKAWRASSDFDQKDTTEINDDTTA